MIETLGVSQPEFCFWIRLSYFTLLTFFFTLVFLLYFYFLSSIKLQDVDKLGIYLVRYLFIRLKHWNIWILNHKFLYPADKW